VGPARVRHLALTIEAVKPFGLGNKDALRSKNMWTLGLALWMFEHDRQPIVDWLKAKFKGKPEIAEANIAALNAGHAYGETAELSGPLKRTHIAPVESEPGLYRTITGAEAVSLGLVAGAQLASLPMFFGGYPITPASAILHHLVRLKEFGITTFQAEDEIAAICAAIGASYAGQLGVTSSSGPGIALKTEAMGLAVMTELPLVIVNSQRGGPSTGPADQDRAERPLPGGLRPQRRHPAAGDLGALARRRVRGRDRGLPHRRAVHDPGDPAHRRLHRQCRRAVEGARSRRATRRSRSNSSRRRTPATRCCPTSATPRAPARGSSPARPGLMHRIGGIEKHVDTGNIDYSPANHQAMTDARKAKIDDIAVPDQEVALGEATGRLAVVGWGSTFGPIHQAVRRRAQAGPRGQPHPRPPRLAAAEEPRRAARGLRQGARPRDEHRPVQDRAARPAAGRRRAADQDQRPAVRDRRARGGDRQVLRRGAEQRGRRGPGQRWPAARAGVGSRRWRVARQPLTTKPKSVRHTLPLPFVLSLSKDASAAPAWFDRLTTNGRRIRSFSVRPEPVEGRTARVTQ
jgi:hypothetical protein